MENLEQIEQRENPTLQPSPKRRYFFLTAAFVVIIGVGALGYLFLTKQGDSSVQPISIPPKNSIDTGFSNLTDLDRSAFLLAQVQEETTQTWFIYEIPLNGDGEKEIWTNSFNTDLGFSRVELSFPSMSKDRNYLSYESGESVLIIDANTGRERTLSLNQPGFFSVSPRNCVWNHQNTNIACLLQNNENDEILFVVDIESGEETILGDSTKDTSLFPKNFSMSLLDWDKNDESITLFGLRTVKHASFLFSVDVASKKVSSVKIVDERLDSRSMKFASQINKLIYASRGDQDALLSIFDPVNEQSKVIYQHPEHFIASDLFLTDDEKYVIFQEDNFTMDFGGGTLPKDGVVTSRIVKVNLESGEEQEFEYPFDPQDSVFFGKEAAVMKGKANFLGSDLVFYHPQEDSIVVENSYFFGENLDEIFSGIPEGRQGEKISETTLYAYSLDTGDLIKIFSRNNTDYPNSEFQFGIIP